MPVAAILNQKGGSGKTTLAVILAEALCATTNPVLVLDGDPQGSARFWRAMCSDGWVGLEVRDAPTTAIRLRSAPLGHYMDGAARQFGDGWAPVMGHHRWPSGTSEC